MSDQGRPVPANAGKEMIDEVRVSIAEAGERTVLENLLQLYIHDFSEHWVGRTEGELGADGRFDRYPLDEYWRDAAFVPLLLRLNGSLVGFALINNVSHVDRVVERNMAEFFIVRKHRGQSIGRAAIHSIFSRYPGRWEIAVARRNTLALSFWRRVVRQYQLADTIEESDIVTASWNGPVLNFNIRPIGEVG